MRTVSRSAAEQGPIPSSAAALPLLLRRPETWIVLLPLIYVLALFLGPWVSSPVAIYAGVVSQPSGALLPGYATIDPNIGQTSFALGKLAAHELLHGRLPVWNHFEGLGQPLVGEAQSAALFPGTLLLQLPGGQTVEHAVLQVVGGLGVLSLLRALRFSPATATTLALAFEFCSLFVWLKNAMVNPIGFLIWLLVFVLRLVDAEPREAWSRHALGLGLAAGFAVLGGFPETVLIFSVFLLAWTAFYALRARLAAAALVRLAARLAAAVVVALLVGAPLLIGLGAFLPAALIGSHLDPGSLGAHLGWQAGARYLLPYATGPLFAYPVPDFSGSIGGYTGVALVVLACLGLVAAGRRGERLFWASAAVLCLGASHGVPVIQAAVMAVPGFKLTAFYRQADVVWILCLMLLAAHGLDSVRTVSRTRFALAVCGFAAGAAGLVALALPDASRWAAALPDVRTWLVASSALGAAIALAVVAGAAARQPHLVAGVLLGETVLFFLLPVLSLPTVAQTDWGFIDYLRQNAGANRVVNFSADVLAANFGSALGIRQLNYDDLPVPAATSTFVHDRLDPLFPASSAIYSPSYPPGPDVARRAALMVGHVADYRAAGVAYLLSPSDAFGIGSAVVSDTNTPFALGDGDTLNFRVGLEPDAVSDRGARAEGRLRVRIATYGGTSDGVLRVKVCDPAGACRSQDVDLRTAEDNGYATLPESVSLSAGGWSDVSLTEVGGSVPVAVWLYDRAAASPGGLALGPVTASRPGAAGIPDLLLTLDATSDVQRVYRGDAADIYRLTDPRPYLAAEGCEVALMSFDRATVDCDRPSVLTRLELWMPGWKANVDGDLHPVTDGGPFQEVAVGAGRHIVSFDYDPFGLKLAMVASLLASSLGCCLWLWLTLRRVGPRGGAA